MAKPLKWLILWVFLGFLINFGIYNYLNDYFLLKWVELIVAYETFYLVFSETGLKKRFFQTFVCLAAVQSVLALIQFLQQSSLGLYRAGESHLSSLILGVAKIVSDETTFIRGYGTFPHPNPLSAFLVIGTLISTYLLLNSYDRRARIGYSVLTFINIFGVIVTFSRAGYLALAIGLIIFLVVLGLKNSIASLQNSLIIIGFSVITAFIIFKPFLMSRVSSEDGSTFKRTFYNQVGLKMVKDNPIFGVGLGKSLLHMEQYSGLTLEPWEKQPPHNYFIIAGAELGILGALFLLWLIFAQLKSLIKRLRSNLTSYNLLLTTILISILILMQFDHYFYTLEQTQLLLWMILGMIAAETRPQSRIAPVSGGQVKNPQEGS